MDHQVIFEREKRCLTADRKKTEEGKKMGNRKKWEEERRRLFFTYSVRQPGYHFRTPLTTDSENSV